MGNGESDSLATYSLADCFVLIFKSLKGCFGMEIS